MRTLLSLVLALSALAVVPTTAEAGPPRKAELHGQLNLNTASVAELDLLPGVGPAMAERIVAYRARQPFKRPEELVRVKGVGRKKFQKLAPYLQVTGPTTLAVGPRATGAGASSGGAAAPPESPPLAPVQGRSAPPPR